jgi:acetyl esterase
VDENFQAKVRPRAMYTLNVPCRFTNGVTQVELFCGIVFVSPKQNAAMPLHPQVLKFLEQQASLGLKPIVQCTPAEFRRMMLDGLASPGESEHVAVVEDRAAPGPAGPVPLRIYRPTPTGRLPALIYFHGGGWVGGNLETHDGLCRAIANAVNCAVIAVDYRLAPEHKYPAAAEDSFAATCWVRDQAAALDIDGRRIAVGGDSAGGNLAAVVSLMARDNHQPAPCLQVLLYPITECDLTTSSYRRFAEGFLLTRAAMQWFWCQYLAREEDAKQPYSAPLQVKDLGGLAPALVLTAEFDVLCDEGETYAERLRAAGVPTELTRYNGMVHGFIPRLNLFDSAQTALVQIATALKRAFSST